MWCDTSSTSMTNWMRKPHPVHIHTDTVFWYNVTHTSQAANSYRETGPVYAAQSHNWFVWLTLYFIDIYCISSEAMCQYWNLQMKYNEWEKVGPQEQVCCSANLTVRSALPVKGCQFKEPASVLEKICGHVYVTTMFPAMFRRSLRQIRRRGQWFPPRVSVLITMYLCFIQI